MSESIARTFGVREQAGIKTDQDQFAEEIQLTGYTIVPGAFGDADLAAARNKMAEIYEKQTAEIGGMDNLVQIGDQFTIMCPIAYDEFFLRFVTSPIITSVIEKLLGEYYCLMLNNGILNVPGAGDKQTPGRWHRDLGYQHFVSSRPLAVTALVCIDDFTENNGGTSLLPGSHKAEKFPSDQYVTRHQKSIEAPAGSVIVFDAMLYHRAGLNRSGQVRRAINTTYSIPLIRPQIDLPRYLKGKGSDDPMTRRLLGYDNLIDDSVLAFRKRRLERARGAVSSQ
jgi:ectoine hydroxylase-related dioxygenase (phytanoyl-CoA dioxygenase family)